MQGTSAASGGVGPTSRSQHVASTRAQLRQRAANASPPAQRKHTVAGSGEGDAKAAAAASNGRPAARAASAQRPRRGDGGGSSSTGGSALPPHSGTDVALLYQQLQDALQQQQSVEEGRQRRLMDYRRQLRAYCDDNATLRNIIQAGEARRRDAAVATGDGDDNPLATGFRVHMVGTRKGPASVTEAELEVVEQRIHLARQRHNRLLHDVRANTAALEKEEKARAALAVEAGTSLDPASLLMGANRPVYLRMMRLEHTLNEVLNRQSTMGVVLKNYRYHLRTLRAEATQYDVQQSMLESEYADRHHDHVQLLALYESALKAYEETVESRTAVQQSGAKMRRAKEKALQQKRRDVDAELAATQQQERRTVDLQQQLEEETQLLEAAENTRSQLEQQRLNTRNALTLLKSTSPSQKANTDSARGNNNASNSDAAAAVGGGGGGTEAENTDERVSAFESAFQGMMSVANAATLDQLVETYQSEMAQQCALQDDLDQLRSRRSALQQETMRLRERALQTKYCVGAGMRFTADGGGDDALPTQRNDADGSDGGAAARANTDKSGSARDGSQWRYTTAASPLMEREMETFLQEEKEALTTQMGENERDQTLVTEVAERINRLAALVGEYRADVRLPAIRLSPALARRSSTLPLHAAVLAQKLLALASDTTAAAADSADSAQQHGDGAQSSRQTGRAIPVVSSTQLVIPANNRRVPLAHERRGGGGGGGGGSGFSGGGKGGADRRVGRLSADVAGISSSAARALLNVSPSSPGGVSPDHAAARRGVMGIAGHVTAGPQQQHHHQRRRRSSASAGAGFIEGQEKDDDAQLATVAALPPAGGRVLDFGNYDDDDDDDDASHSSGAMHSGSDSSDYTRRRSEGADGSDAVGSASASLRDGLRQQRRRRSSAAMMGGGASAAAAAGVAADDGQEDPLRRDEVKKMSEMLQERRKRDMEKTSGRSHN